MKHRNKRLLRMVAALALLLLLTGCGGAPEWEEIRSFEFHFVQEEYDAAYDTIRKTVELESGEEYRICVSSQCETGTIRIMAESETGKKKTKIAQWQAPCEEIVSLAENSAERFTLTILIDAQTEGDVKAEFFRAES